jgi:hypothetical protein
MTVLLIIILLVVAPAAAALLSEPSFFLRVFTGSALAVGAPVVYRREEISTCPGPDAVDVYPSAHGEFYYYSLVRYLRVVEVLGDGRVIAVDCDNKSVCLLPNDSNLRRARLTERLIHRWNFRITDSSAVHNG